MRDTLGNKRPVHPAIPPFRKVGRHNEISPIRSKNTPPFGQSNENSNNEGTIRETHFIEIASYATQTLFPKKPEHTIPKVRGMIGLFQTTCLPNSGHSRTDCQFRSHQKDITETLYYGQQPTAPLSLGWGDIDPSHCIITREPSHGQTDEDGLWATLLWLAYVNAALRERAIAMAQIIGFLMAR